MVMNEEVKSRVKTIFNEWLDLVESREALNKEMGELKREVADTLNIKTGVVSKLFSYLRKIYSGGEDELEVLRILAEDIK